MKTKSQYLADSYETNLMISILSILLSCRFLFISLNIVNILGIMYIFWNLIFGFKAPLLLLLVYYFGLIWNCM